jgi:hypothetical protein
MSNHSIEEVEMHSGNLEKIKLGDLIKHPILQIKIFG